LSGNLTFSANVTINGLIANGGIGTAGHTLHSDGTKVYWAADDQGVTSVATGNGLTGGTITATGTLSVLANTGIIANATGVYVNSSYIGTLTSNNATYAFGKTEGALNVNTASIPVFTGDAVDKADITTRVDSGFYETSTGTTAEGWPLNDTSYQSMLSITHVNNGNYYAMQIGGSFFDQELYFRKTNNSGTTAWTKLMHVNNTLKVYNAAGTLVFP
jgi:hypothetical protein